MADDMEDIEDMLEAPYKNIATKEHAERTHHVIITFFSQISLHIYF